MAPGTITNNHIPLAALQRLPIFCSLQMSISSNSNSYTLHKYLSASQPHNLSQLSAGGSTSNPNISSDIHRSFSPGGHFRRASCFHILFFFHLLHRHRISFGYERKKSYIFLYLSFFLLLFFGNVFLLLFTKSGRLSLLVCLRCLLVYAFMLYDTDLPPYALPATCFLKYCLVRLCMYISLSFRLRLLTILLFVFSLDAY